MGDFIGSANATGVWAGDSGAVIERNSIDCTTHLEQAKALRSSGLVGSGEMRHAAHYPPGFADYYCQLKGISYHELMTNQAVIMEMLSDPDLSGFRVWQGRVK